LSSTPQPDNNSAMSPPIITKKDKIATVADEIISLDKNGEDPLSGSTYVVQKHNVIGKVVKVITAFSQEWKNVFYEFKDRKWLLKTLEKNLDLYKNTGYSNQRQIVGEIERRLSKLKEEQR
jgi:hypothetical protein